ncbi:MAG: OadG family protein [Verrucomicrobiota bacterium]
MFRSFILLSALSGETLNSTTNIVVVGFLFVLLVLGTLAVMTSISGRLFNAFSPSEEPVKQTAVATAGAAQDESHMPVIAAAVHFTLGDQPHRIVSVEEDDAQ